MLGKILDRILPYKMVVQKQVGVAVVDNIVEDMWNIGGKTYRFRTREKLDKKINPDSEQKNLGQMFHSYKIQREEGNTTYVNDFSSPAGIFAYDNMSLYYKNSEEVKNLEIGDAFNLTE